MPNRKSAVPPAISGQSEGQQHRFADMSMECSAPIRFTVRAVVSWDWKRLTVQHGDADERPIDGGPNREGK
ncbi:MAG: hypothetical protein AAF483_26350 [Planctomycetota bacterium]